MITVLAFDELQKAAPETTITSLNTPFDGFCSIGIEPPKYIRDYFKEFLSKAKQLTAGSECKAELMRDGNIRMCLILPNRIYRMGSLTPEPIFRIEETQEAGPKHKEIIRDAAGHEKIIWVFDKIKDPREE